MWCENVLLLFFFKKKKIKKIFEMQMHSYPSDLRSPEFSASDYRVHGKITFGSLPAMTGWLAKQFPTKPYVRTRPSLSLCVYVCV